MKKTLMTILLVMFTVFLGNAQVMTDEQIMDFIVAEQAKGNDQQTVARELLKRGVSIDRLKSLKEKYEAEEVQPGAVNLLDNSSKKNNERLRTKRNKGKSNSKSSNAMLKSRRDDYSSYSEDEQLLMYEDALSFIDFDSLAYGFEEEEVEEGLSVFGRNMFSNEFLTFEPVMNIPIPADYILGAGDNVLIDIWGNSHEKITGEISPDGNIIVNGVGPLQLAGKTIAEAKVYLKGVLGEVYAESEVSLSVGELRSIQVQIVGEVIMPGTYTVSALSTVFNALYAAGGISDYGTLREIRVYRDSKLQSTIDVYDFIFNGNQSGNIRLQDNDVISVGAYEAIVNIAGKVKRPMLYEMKEDETLAKLVRYAGGFSGDAYKENLRLIRKSGREYSLHTIAKDELENFTMIDGDSVYIDSVIPRFSNMVEVSGAVFFPGQYQFSDKIKTVYELINVAGGVREDAFLNRAILHHRNNNGTIEAKSVNLKGLMEGTLPDIPLQNNDVLYILSENEMKGDLTIKIGGEVRFPGIYKFVENTTIEDIIIQAGGLTRAASTTKVDVFRKLYNPKASCETENIMETFSFELKDGLIVDEEQGFILEPYDEVHIRRSPVYNVTSKNVSIEGAVNFEGEYVLLKQNYRLSDLVNVAGGLSLSAYPQGAYLHRKMTEDEMAQRDVLLKSSMTELYEEMLRPDRTSNQALLDSLYKVKLNLGEYYPVAVNLKEAIDEPGSQYDLVLREGDKLIVPQYTTTVKVSGEVKRPISLNWQEGKKLKYYIGLAGGLSNAAKKKGIYVIYMNGRVEEISKHSKKAIQPGCEIVVPRKTKRYMTTGEIATIGTSVVSMTTMIATLINILTNE